MYYDEYESGNKMIYGWKFYGEWKLGPFSKEIV